MPVSTQPAPELHGDRDPALDGLRGVAILLVFIFHYGGGLRARNPLVHAFGLLTQAGWVGVDLFFVLSGFLITSLLWRNRHAARGLRHFAARRALRILPVYLAALMAAAAAALFYGASLHQLRPLLLYLGFLQNIPAFVSLALRYPPPLPLNHLWTLAVEEQFYLLWPVLLLLIRSRRQALWASVSIFGAACLFRAVLFRPATASAQDLSLWAPFLFTRVGALALGSALALKENRLPRVAALALCCGGFAGFLLTGWADRSLLLNSPRQFSVGLPCVELACAGTLAVALGQGLWRTVLCAAPLRFFGRISYGFYVLHVLLEPVFNRLGEFPTHTSHGTGYLLRRMLMAWAVTTLLATFSFRFFEQPILRWKRFFPTERPPVV